MEFFMLSCWQKDCPQTFYTLNDLSTHHLDTHERQMLRTNLPQAEVWTPTPPQEPFRPPNYKAQAARAWYDTGEKDTACSPPA